MREQTKKLKRLASEFKSLKLELFGADTFVVLDESNSPKVTRYNQLLQLFYPQYRTMGWENPLTL